MTKPALETWGVYLREGVSFMEGTHPDLRYAGQRWFPEARATFEECAAQDDDLAVQGEAYFRAAQCAHYAGDRRGALDWIVRGRERLEVIGTYLPRKTRAKCLATEGIVHADMGRYEEAQAATRHAWRVAPEGRLRGDCANRLGRLYAEHWRDLGWNRRLALAEALDWFMTARQDIKDVRNPDGGDFHALAVVCGRIGVAIQRLYGYRNDTACHHFREAERLFTASGSEPCIRATYWWNRAMVAARTLHPLDSFRFFLRWLWPEIACLRQMRRTSSTEHTARERSPR